MPGKTTIAAEAPAKGAPWTTAQLEAGLKAWFAPPAHALLFEVPDGTGGHRTRSADALAMGLWPSRGLHLIGFEIKASRSDWARELADPAKADAVARYCDFWYLVVGRRDLVAPGELPATWGLIAPDERGAKLKLYAEPSRLEPTPIDRTFLAALFRRAHEKVEREDPVNVAREEGRKQGFEEGKRSAENIRDWTTRHQLEEFAGLKKVVAEFEAASGVRLDRHSWNARHVGAALRIVLGGNLADALHPMERVEREARRIVEIAEAFRAGVAPEAEEGGAPCSPRP